MDCLVRTPIEGAERIMDATTAARYAPKGMNSDIAIGLGFVLVSCSSHRARTALVGRGEAQGYFSMRRASKGGYYAVNPALLPRKGVTKLRGPYDDIMMCW